MKKLSKKESFRPNFEFCAGSRIPFPATNSKLGICVFVVLFWVFTKLAAPRDLCCHRPSAAIHHDGHLSHLLARKILSPLVSATLSSIDSKASDVPPLPWWKVSFGTSFELLLLLQRHHHVLQTSHKNINRLPLINALQSSHQSSEFPILFVRCP